MELLTKFLKHVSHHKVELHYHIVYLLHTLPILASIQPQVVGRTAYRCQPHHHHFSNIRIVQVLDTININELEIFQENYHPVACFMDMIMLYE